MTCTACENLKAINVKCNKHRVAVQRPTTWTDTPEHTLTVTSGHVGCTCGYVANVAQGWENVIAAEHGRGIKHIVVG